MASLADVWNQTALARTLNTPGGRVFRAAAGVAFIAVGFAYRNHALGVASMIWGLFPLSAGVLDLCWVSAALGGPLSGARLRAKGQSG